MSGLPPLVIYHGDCYDGFTAAWIAHRYFDGELELFKGVYAEAPPNVEGRAVYIFDFSYPRETLRAMAALADSIVVCDHHLSARPDLQGLPFAIFDLARSGAGLAWDHFHDAPRPAWVDAVEDRDLWRFDLPETRHVHAAIASRPMTLEAWDDIDQTPLEDLVAEGKAVARYIETRAAKAAKESRRILWCGRYWAVLNHGYEASSEVARHLMDAEHVPLSATYYQLPDLRWQFSLRSRSPLDSDRLLVGDPAEHAAYLDVAEVAKQYGGGGHYSAAGFVLDELPPVFVERG